MSHEVTEKQYESGKRIIEYFVSALTNTGLYSISHPQTKKSISEMLNILTELFQEIEQLEVLILGSKILIGKKAVDEKSLYYKKFAKKLKSASIESVIIINGVSSDEIINIVKQLGGKTGKKNDEDFSVQETEHIKLGRIAVKKGSKQSSLDGEEDEVLKEVSDEAVEMQEYSRVLGNLYDFIRQFQESLQYKKQLDVDSIHDKVSHFIYAYFHKTDNSKIDLINKISDTEYDFTHTLNVSMLTLAMAEALEINEDLMEDIVMSSLLYDIGKSEIPKKIWLKRGNLTAQDRKMIESHPMLGAKKLLKMKNIPPLAVVVAFEHHMPYNLKGRGYPRFSSHKAPNVVSQIVGIADYFDALQLDHPYRPAYSLERSIELLLHETEKKFDPLLLKVFIENVLPKIIE